MAEQQKVSVTLSNKSIIRVILYALLVVALYALRDLILVILTAIVIASFIETGVRFLGRRGFGRTISVVAIYLFSFLVLAGLFYLFIPVLIEELNQLTGLIAKYLPQAKVLTDAGAAISTTSKSGLFGGNFSIGNAITSVQSLSQSVAGGFFQTLFALFGGIANVVLIVVISFYLSVEERGIEKFLRILTPVKQEEYVVSLWERTRHKISRWVQGQLVLGLVVGILVFIGLLILNIPYAFVIAVITAILELVPFGMILATVPAVVLGFVEGGTSTGLMTLGLFIVIQQIENYILVPLIVRRATGVPPLIVIISLLIGVKLAGFWGLVLAMPVSVFILELISDIEKKKFFEKEERERTSSVLPHE